MQTAGSFGSIVKRRHGATRWWINGMRTRRLPRLFLNISSAQRRTRQLNPATLAAAICASLAGCAAAPVESKKPLTVETGALSPEYSSFNATVVSGAGAVNQTFTASLDPGLAPSLESLTRLESSVT